VVKFAHVTDITICKTDVAGKLEKFRPNPLKFNFRAMVVTVCSMKKSEKVQRISAFENPG
jgi:hypothetical protein